MSAKASLQGQYKLGLVRISFLTHKIATGNTLYMWHRKCAMQIQTEHKMIWFEKLLFRYDETGVTPPSYTLNELTTIQSFSPVLLCCITLLNF